VCAFKPAALLPVIAAKPTSTSMNKLQCVFCAALSVLILIIGCTKNDAVPSADPYAAIKASFGAAIDPGNLSNYANQGKPAYINKDNAAGATISNSKATLGRVLFYDPKLSIDNSIACASCHKQQFAFSDTALVSNGVAGGTTARHSMRLINTRYAVESKFFWDERASTLEQQTTMPIQDHAEMGFSGVSGRPGLPALLSKLQQVDYYRELFQFVYSDTVVTEARLQECLAQFIRSIQSFDTKYDAGRAQVANDAQPFPNFTAQENAGKQTFLTPPVFNAAGVRISGGAGCNACHNAPEFDIDPNSRNNGIIRRIAAPGLDLNVTRAPSLRELTNADGIQNGPLMHTGNLATIQNAIGHYGNINLAAGNNNLDPRLMPGGFGQQLNFNAQEVNGLIAFLHTLTGTNVYTDPKWSNPFK
jgi:cytochrome c peroxidase